jgi:hypothetical protein
MPAGKADAQRAEGTRSALQERPEVAVAADFACESLSFGAWRQPNSTENGKGDAGHGNKNWPKHNTTSAAIYDEFQAVSGLDSPAFLKKTPVQFVGADLFAKQICATADRENKCKK